MVIKSTKRTKHLHTYLSTKNLERLPKFVGGWKGEHREEDLRWQEDVAEGAGEPLTPHPLL